MKRIVSALIVLLPLFISQMLPLPLSAADEDRDAPSQLTRRIKYLVDNSQDAIEFTTGEEILYVPQLIRRFYERREYLAAWAGHEGSFRNAAELINVIKGIHGQGLIPEYYHLKAINEIMDLVMNDIMSGTEDLAKLDLFLTDAFLMLGCHFSAGCVNPVTVESEWFLNRTDLELDIVLEDALQANAIGESLSILLPPREDYIRLRQYFDHYRKLVADGGWLAVEAGRSYRTGDTGEIVARLKELLMKAGDLKEAGNEDVIDNQTEAAIRRFQKRHGIQSDGVAGPDTIKALNVPVQERLKQIEVNLERMRWASRSLGHRYIVVNIADYNLRIIEHDETVMSMEVVVGKPFWNTPVFSDEIKYVILNPTWIIPMSIVRNEILPKVKESPEYLEDQGIRIINGWLDDDEEIDPRTINWAEATAGNFKYKMRQSPGEYNPLGRIKFMLPNRFNIYLHDTPARGLFSRNNRAFSHGCIRIRHPVDLAEHLLRDDPEWTRENISTALDKGEEVRIDLKTPVSVHILYYTAWVDEAGMLHFRDDVYDRDERLYQAMKKKPAEYIK